MRAHSRILGVGTNPEPVLASFKEENPPVNVLFLVSEESKKTLREDILPSLPYSPHHHLVELSDPNNIQESYRETQRQIAPWMRKHGLDGLDVAVDITGGTKVMSSVLILLATEVGFDTIYVDGDRDENGTVITGTERLVPFANPHKVFAVRELADAETLLNLYHADAASQILKSGVENCAPIYRRSLQAYQQLSESLASADLFAFNGPGALHQFRQSEVRISKLLSPALTEHLRQLYAHWERVAADTANNEMTAGKDTLLELLANARRRANQARYDDAVARLYRAMELRGQQLLKEAFGGELGNVSRSNLGSLEEEQFETLGLRCRDGMYRIQGLATIYAALGKSSKRDIQSEALQFRIIRETHTKLRNLSLLGHGLKPVDRHNFESFWSAALFFLQVKEEQIPNWPEFELLLE